MKPPTTLILLIVSIYCRNVLADFWTDRNTILGNEASQLIGSSIILTEDEQKVNDILMELKLKEYDQGFADPSTFLPSIHFFHSKSAIERSEVFKFIQRVPKGASLHAHFSAMLSFDALFDLTYMEGLHGCDDDGTFKLRFFFNEVDDQCEWKLLNNSRNEDSKFDDFLKSKLTLIVDDPVAVYEDINDVWNTFEKIFTLTGPLFEYRQFLHDYFYQVLQEFYDDNVRYLEIRSILGTLFDRNNTIYEVEEVVGLFLDTLEEFRKYNPAFLGFRFIYAPSRKTSNKTMAESIAAYLEIKNKYPDLIAGFDLIGQEDLGEPLSAFADQLVEIANQTKFFFHAAETNWYGTSTDLNLVDAVALNTSRIGHGFGITKHPEILKITKEKGIAIEVNPLSNQVLKLVDDLRNHVGAHLIATGHPVVITCDDPSFWGAKGLSYDWYMAFMAMTPRNGDLRVLKQLAINSFRYSSLSEEELYYAMALLERWWQDFVNEILDTY